MQDPEDLQSSQAWQTTLSQTDTGSGTGAVGGPVTFPDACGEDEDVFGWGHGMGG